MKKVKKISLIENKFFVELWNGWNNKDNVKEKKEPFSGWMFSS